MWLMTFKKIHGKLLQNNFLVLCVNHIRIPVYHFKQTFTDFSDELLSNIIFIPFILITGKYFLTSTKQKKENIKMLKSNYQVIMLSSCILGK